MWLALSKSPPTKKKQITSSSLESQSSKIVFLAFIVIELLLFSFVSSYSEYAIEKGETAVDAFKTKSLSFSTSKGLKQELIGFYNVSKGEAISAIVLDEGAFANWDEQQNCNFSIFANPNNL